MHILDSRRKGPGLIACLKSSVLHSLRNVTRPSEAVDSGDGVSVHCVASTETSRSLVASSCISGSGSGIRSRTPYPPADMSCWIVYASKACLLGCPNPVHVELGRKKCLGTTAGLGDARQSKQQGSLNCDGTPALFCSLVAAVSVDWTFRDAPRGSPTYSRLQ